MFISLQEKQLQWHEVKAFCTTRLKQTAECSIPLETSMQQQPSTTAIKGLQCLQADHDLCSAAITGKFKLQYCQTDVVH